MRSTAADRRESRVKTDPDANALMPGMLIIKPMVMPMIASMMPRIAPTAR